MSTYSSSAYIEGDLSLKGQLQINTKVFNKYVISIPTYNYEEANTSIRVHDLLFDSAALPETTLIDTNSIMSSLYPTIPVLVRFYLPKITSKMMGMTFNFIKNNENSTVRFIANTTDRITSINFTESSYDLLKKYITSTQLIVSSNFMWVVNYLYLPPQISNPVGSIITMPINRCPSGYLFCNGDYYINAYYSDLYDVIGYTYGQKVQGNIFYEQFRVPPFNNGSFLRGINGNSAAIGVQQSDIIKNHTHTVSTKTYQGGSGDGRVPSISPGTGSYGPENFSSGTNSSGDITETRPINFAVVYCIKY